MMKLIRATFKNFRLLKDLRLDFSTSAERPLTVIRAANETGKTTCQYALMWALYGSKQALPHKGAYQLYPSDEMDGGPSKLDIYVEVEFETEHVRSVGRGRREVEARTYRLRRSCVERNPSDGNVIRESETQAMFEVTPTGTKPIPDHEVKAIIEDALPEALKNVYFTDGDRAMSFIEAAAAQGVKRQRVHNAIESLLGLKTLERTIRHLDNVSAKFGREIDDTDYANQIEILSDQISGHKEDIEQWQREKEEIDQQLQEARKHKEHIRRDLDEALKLGDKEKLVSDKKSTERNIRRLKDNTDSSLHDMSKILYGDVVSKALVGSLIEDAKSQLKAMNDKKQLPKVNVPILEELLERDLCFCGAELRESMSEGEARRSKIKQAIEESREADEIQEAASSLFYRIRSEDCQNFGETWVGEYAAVSARYQNDLSSLSDEEDRYRSLDADIKRVDDSEVVELKEFEDIIDEKIQSLRGDQATLGHKIDDAASRLKVAEEELQKARKRSGKTDDSTARWDLALKARDVFEEIRERLVKDEVKNVSKEMNRIFLSMIGSDPDQSNMALITEARLTDEFDIVVFGPHGHKLNPDQDLNGASRRAITLSFILALTKVSEVEAPNVIDTPLGMMTGYVKQSVLLNTLKEGSQVILFLTPDEIKGVENILDEYAGRIYTLTNPAHYPKMLVNEPPVPDARVVRCDCNHHESCEVCSRKGLEVA